MNTDDIERQLETAAREHNRTVDVDTQWWRLQGAMTGRTRPTRTREHGRWLVPALAAGATLVVAAGAIGIGSYSRTVGHPTTQAVPAGATSRPTQPPTQPPTGRSSQPPTQRSVSQPAYTPPPRSTRPAPELGLPYVITGPVAPHASPDRLALTPSPPHTYANLPVSYNCSMLSTPAGALFPRNLLDQHQIVNRQPLTPPRHAALDLTYGIPCTSADKQGGYVVATYQMSSVILTAQTRHQDSDAARLSNNYEFVGYRYDSYRPHHSETVTAAIWDRGSLYSLTMRLTYVRSTVDFGYEAWAGVWNPASPPRLQKLDSVRGFTPYPERY